MLGVRTIWRGAYKKKSNDFCLYSGEEQLNSTQAGINVDPGSSFETPSNSKQTNLHRIFLNFVKKKSTTTTHYKNRNLGIELMVFSQSLYGMILNELER